MFFKFNPITQQHEPRPIVVPYWLKQYLDEENISLNRFVKALNGVEGDLTSILSEQDIKVYIAMQQVIGVYADYNPLASLIQVAESTDSIIRRTLASPEWVQVAVGMGEYPQHTQMRAIYYEAMLGANFAYGFNGDFSGKAWLTGNTPQMKLTPALVEDCLIICVEPSGDPIDMKAFASQCIELLYSSMSFSQIVRSPYMSLYMKAARALFTQR